MALNIFEQYGIKEVANVYFQALASDTSSNISEGDIVLYLDTLKVSTIEQTAEQVDARGGWGNPKLITWDYGKEITLTLTDALISMESLRLMMGGSIKEATASNTIKVYRSAEGTLNSTGNFESLYDGATKQTITSTDTSVGLGKLAANTKVKWLNLTKGTRGQFSATDATAPLTVADLNSAFLSSAASGTFAADDVVRLFWEEERNGGAATTSNAVQVIISPSTFPGTYRVVGDTFIRSAKTGADEAFQFVINKAKVASNVTITLEAEGDPSTFDMTLTVLRDGDEMMSLNRY